jgi:hypothetical protein
VDARCSNRPTGTAGTAKDLQALRPVAKKAIAAF